MLTFSTEQVRALAQALSFRLEDEPWTRIRQHYPHQVQVLGEGPLRAFVRLVIKRALGYGLDSQYACSHYLGIGLSLGAFFDLDPQYPWARDILADQGLDAERKIARLRSVADRYLGTITGPGDGHLHAALRQTQILAANPDFGALSQDRKASIADLLRVLYPQKYATLTPEILTAFAAEARYKANAYGVTDRPTLTLLVILMFLLGSGCDHDPLYPRIRDALGMPAAEPATKRRRLFAASRRYLQHHDRVLLREARLPPVGGEEKGAGRRTERKRRPRGSQDRRWHRER